MVRSLTLGLACVVLLGCTTDLTNRDRLVEGEVLQARLDTWVRLMNNARRDSLTMMYDSSASLVVAGLDNRTAVGMEQVRGLIGTFFDKLSFMNFVDQDPKIDVLTPNVAVTLFRHSTDIVLANRTRVPVQSGLASLVWVKDRTSRTWKIHTQHLVISVPGGR